MSRFALPGGRSLSPRSPAQPRSSRRGRGARLPSVAFRPITGPGLNLRLCVDLDSPAPPVARPPPVEHPPPASGPASRARSPDRSPRRNEPSSSRPRSLASAPPPASGPSTTGGPHPRPGHRRRRPIGIHHSDDCLADSQLLKCLRQVVVRLGNVATVCFRALASFGVCARNWRCTREPSCASTSSGTSFGVWVNEEDADSGSDQPYGLRDRVEKGPGCIGEEQMGFIEKKTNFGLSISPTSGRSWKRSASSHQESGEQGRPRLKVR